MTNSTADMLLKLDCIFFYTTGSYMVLHYPLYHTEVKCTVLTCFCLNKPTPHTQALKHGSFCVVIGHMSQVLALPSPGCNCLFKNRILYCAMYTKSLCTNTLHKYYFAFKAEDSQHTVAHGHVHVHFQFGFFFS